MDMEDIHYLLGGTIFARAENYMKHIESLTARRRKWSTASLRGNRRQR